MDGWTDERKRARKRDKVTERPGLRYRDSDTVIRGGGSEEDSVERDKGKQSK